jgi:hypothetical protein
MKSSPELKFDIIVKDVFHSTLKPLGYKKRGNNFYIEKNGIGKIINLQKSTFCSKDHISFTINTGLFLPEYWQHYYNYQNKPIPIYPTESECILRRRIGRLLNTKDTWYDINEDTDIEETRFIQTYNLTSVLLPYFNNINSDEDILREIEKGNALALSTVAKLFMLGKLNRCEDFKLEYKQLLNRTTINSIEESLKALAITFNIEVEE